MDFIQPNPTIRSVASLAPLVSLTPAASNQPPSLNHTTVPFVDLEYGADDETQEPHSNVLAEQPVLFNDEQVENGQFGGSKTQKRIEFDESDCRLVFRKALLCKTFTLQAEYAEP